MPRLIAGVAFATCFGVAAIAQPVVTGIENNYSYVLPGLPNYGIAQGSIFVIFGTDLTTASSGLQGVPLKTALGGVSVQFNVQGVTTQALLYYVTPTQIAGVLPSATPIGTGFVNVIVNGRTSASAPIKVVQSAFGIAFGMEPIIGNGDIPYAAVLDIAGNLLSSANAANPGDTISLYGTGAGPVSGDETGPQPVRNLTNIPIEVDIGGIPSTVTYHGRSSYPGLDQINVVVPQGALGCHVSVAVISSGLVSNIPFLPIAAQGRNCTDAVAGVNLPSLLDLTGKSAYSIGNISLERFVQRIPGAMIEGGGTIPELNFTQDSVNANFAQYNIPSWIVTSPPFPSLGSCEVESSQFMVQSAQLVVQSAASSASPFTNLDAGPFMRFVGPNGTVTEQEGSPGYYGGLVGGGMTNPLPLFIPSTGGVFSIDNGSGGPDVGAFTSQIDFPTPLVWTNRDSISSTIVRSKGVTVTWTGGDPDGIVSILAGSVQQTATGSVLTSTSANMSCVAPVSAGQFTIPPSALLALPVNLTEGGYLLLRTSSTVLFSAPGLDGGSITASTESNMDISFQ